MASNRPPAAMSLPFMSALFKRLILPLGLSVCLAACSTAPVERQHEMSRQAVPYEAWVRQAPVTSPVRYRLQVGDVVDLQFRRVGELNRTLTVRPDGLVTLPWVGEVQAAGFTPLELGAEVERSYAGVLNEPRVDVLVQSFRPSRVYVGGEVARPGEIELPGRISLLQAVVRAGDFTPDAQRDSVIVIRQRGAAEPEYVLVDFGSSVMRRVGAAAEQPCSDGNPLACPGVLPLRPEGFMLEPLDVVFVPKTRIAGVAQFFERYVNQIVPLWRNFGLSLTYMLTRDTIVVPASR